jgi:hypothetical protein
MGYDEKGMVLDSAVRQGPAGQTRRAGGDPVTELCTHLWKGGDVIGHVMMFANLLFSMVLMVYSWYFVFNGRRIDKAMMVINAVAGTLSSLLYGVFVIDHFVIDIVNDMWFRDYCIRPVYFFMICALIASSIRIGRKPHGLDT